MQSIKGGKKDSGLTPGQEEILDQVINHWRKELKLALPELNAGIFNSKSSGSFSATLQISPAKTEDNFKAKSSTRTRTPRPPMEWDLHFNDSAQLELGFVQYEDDDEVADG